MEFYFELAFNSLMGIGCALFIGYILELLVYFIAED